MEDAQTLPYTSVPLKESGQRGGSGYNTPRSTSGNTTPNGSHSKKKNWNMFGQSQAGLEAGQMGEKRPRHGRNGSWDLLGNSPDWEGYNPATAKNENLRFAEGDVGTNKVGRRCD